MLVSESRCGSSNLAIQHGECPLTRVARSAGGPVHVGSCVIRTRCWGAPSLKPGFQGGLARREGATRQHRAPLASVCCGSRGSIRRRLTRRHAPCEDASDHGSARFWPRSCRGPVQGSMHRTSDSGSQAPTESGFRSASGHAKYWPGGTMTKGSRRLWPMRSNYRSLG